LPCRRAPTCRAAAAHPTWGRLSLPSRSRRLRRGSDHWQDNAAYLYGHRLLEAGFYWEAHEVWEAVWMNCRPNSTEKVLLQALIQQANARLKRKMGKVNAARQAGIDG
jgi:hypothetical protein